MKPFLVWLILAQSADIATTKIGLSHGCVEGNPIAASHMKLAIAVKVGIPLVDVWSLPHLHHTHPRLAKWFAVLPAMSGTTAAAWNTYQLTRAGCR